MVIGVPKWLKKDINGPFVAISRPGGSKPEDQNGLRLDLCILLYSSIEISWC